MGGSHQRQAD
jgi:hypothetical protein